MHLPIIQSLITSRQYDCKYRQRRTSMRIVKMHEENTSKHGLYFPYTIFFFHLHLNYNRPQFFFIIDLFEIFLFWVNWMNDPANFRYIYVIPLNSYRINDGVVELKQSRYTRLIRTGNLKKKLIHLNKNKCLY